MIGETPPSSAVIGFFSFGRLSRLRRAVAAAPEPRRRSPHDRVERRRGAGDVDVRRCRGDRSGTRRRRRRRGRSARSPGSMSGASARSKTGEERILRRVELQQRDAVAREQLVEHVEHRDRGDVAGTEHEPDRRRASSGAAARDRPTRRASSAVTPGSNHTSPVNPDSSRPSTGPSGKTWARTRPPGAASVFTPFSGLSPFASFRSVRAVGVERGERPRTARRATPRRAADARARCPSTWRRRRPTPRRRR